MTELITGELTADDIFALLTSESMRGKYVIWPMQEAQADTFWIYKDMPDDLAGMLQIKKH